MQDLWSANSLRCTLQIKKEAKQLQYSSEKRIRLSPLSITGFKLKNALKMHVKMHINTPRKMTTDTWQKKCKDTYMQWRSYTFFNLGQRFSLRSSLRHPPNTMPGPRVLPSFGPVSLTPVLCVSFSHYGHFGFHLFRIILWPSYSFFLC